MIEIFDAYRRENDTKIDDLRDEIEGHVNDERSRDVEMASQIAVLNKQIAVLTEEVKVLIDAWSQAKGAVTFMKIMATIVAAGAAAWAWISANLHIAPK